VTAPIIPALVGAWADYDNDGRVDLGVASMQGGATAPSAIYRNLGGGKFEQATVGANLQGDFNGFMWGDYDNDGFLDFCMTYGGGRNYLFRNNGNGTFTSITQGIVVTDRAIGGGVSYAGVWWDYDNDGFLDLFVPNGNDANTAQSLNFIYHNEGNSNAWLKVKPVGTVSNRDGAGAKVRVQATYAGQSRWQRRDITAGDCYNGNNFIAHFGLGDATVVETLRIEWPSGIVQELQSIAPRQMLTLVEPPPLKASMVSGHCEISVKCWKNQAFDILASTDLAEWTQVGSVTNVNGTNATFVDPRTATPSQCFYRAQITKP
jgi:enediyne biosynthesis protein E4